MKILRKYEKEIAELYHINNLMFIIGTNNDFVPQDVGESVYYLFQPRRRGKAAFVRERT